MAYTRAWDEAFPADTQLANLLGQDVRNTKADVRERVSSFGGGTLANRPTPEAVFVGVLYFATDNGKIYRWNGAAWDDVTADFIPVIPPTPTQNQMISLLLGLAEAQNNLTYYLFRANQNCTITRLRGIFQGTGNVSMVLTTGHVVNCGGVPDVWAEQVASVAVPAGTGVAGTYNQIGPPDQASFQIDITVP